VRGTLHGRLLRVLAAFILATTGVFTAAAFVFMLELDDAHMAQRLEAEAQWMQGKRQPRGAWPSPRDPAIRLVQTPAELPGSVARLLQQEPERIEFPGEAGSHFHLRALSPSPAGPWLLLDAGSTLVVRRWWLGIAATFLALAFMLCAIALLAADAVARKTTRPLADLARQIEAADPLLPPERINGIEAADREVATFIGGVNRLLGRVHALVDRERRFARDASHELRTPLAAMRSAAEQVAADPRVPAHARALGDVIGRSSRHLGRTIDTLLRLALDPETNGEASARVLPVLERVVLDLAVLGDDEGVAAVVDVPADARVDLPSDVLALLLANLLVNAYRHSVGDEVRVDVTRTHLRLRNAAPLRDASSNRSDRTGLGLEIAQRLCARHGVELSLRLDDGIAEVTLPLSAPPTS